MNDFSWANKTVDEVLDLLVEKRAKVPSTATDVIDNVAVADKLKDLKDQITGATPEVKPDDNQALDKALKWGLGGAGIGALIGGGSSFLAPKKKRNVLSNAITGALVGGAGGAGLSLVGGTEKTDLNGKSPEQSAAEDKIDRTTMGHRAEVLHQLHQAQPDNFIKSRFKGTISVPKNIQTAWKNLSAGDAIVETGRQLDPGFRHLFNDKLGDPILNQGKDGFLPEGVSQKAFYPDLLMSQLAYDTTMSGMRRVVLPGWRDPDAFKRGLKLLKDPTPAEAHLKALVGRSDLKDTLDIRNGINPAVPEYRSHHVNELTGEPLAHGGPPGQRVGATAYVPSTFLSMPKIRQLGQQQLSEADLEHLPKPTQAQAFKTIDDKYHGLLSKFDPSLVQDAGTTNAVLKDYATYAKTTGGTRRMYADLLTNTPHLQAALASRRAAFDPYLKVKGMPNFTVSELYHGALHNGATGSLAATKAMRDLLSGPDADRYLGTPYADAKNEPLPGFTTPTKPIGTGPWKGGNNERPPNFGERESYNLTNQDLLKSIRQNPTLAESYYAKAISMSKNPQVSPDAQTAWGLFANDLQKGTPVEAHANLTRLLDPKNKIKGYNAPHVDSVPTSTLNEITNAGKTQRYTETYGDRGPIRRILGGNVGGANTTEWYNPLRGNKAILNSKGNPLLKALRIIGNTSGGVIRNSSKLTNVPRPLFYGATPFLEQQLHHSGNQRGPFSDTPRHGPYTLPMAEVAISGNDTYIDKDFSNKAKQLSAILGDDAAKQVKPETLSTSEKKTITGIIGDTGITNAERLKRLQHVLGIRTGYEGQRPAKDQPIYNPTPKQ